MDDLLTAVTALLFTWTALVALLILCGAGLYLYACRHDGDLDVFVEEGLARRDLSGNEAWHDSRPSWEKR